LLSWQKNPTFALVSTPAEIESAIEKLPTGQLLAVAAWLDDYRTMIQSSENMFERLDSDEAEGL
jgi:hypothetical protein